MEMINKEQLDEWLFEHCVKQGHTCTAVKGEVNGKKMNIAFVDAKTGERFDIIRRKNPKLCNICNHDFNQCLCDNC